LIPDISTESSKAVWRKTHIAMTIPVSRLHEEGRTMSNDTGRLDIYLQNIIDRSHVDRSHVGRLETGRQAVEKSTMTDIGADGMLSTPLGNEDRLMRIQSLLASGEMTRRFSAEPPRLRMFDASEIPEVERQAVQAAAAGVLVFCSLGVARGIRKRGGPLANGLFYEPQRLHVRQYAPQLPVGAHINEDAIYLPWSALARNADRLFAFFGTESLFVRPDSPDKPFTGFSATRSDFASEIEALRQTACVTPEELCLVAAGCAIDPVEWRSWMIEGKIVAWAGYSWDQGVMTAAASNTAPESKRPPAPILELAERLAPTMEGYDNAVVADFAMTQNGPRLIEINAPSTSGIYAGADFPAIVAALANILA